MARWRLGVVLLFAPALRNELQGLRRALGDGSLDRIEPHITLVPPVNVRIDDIPGVLVRLHQVAEQREPFPVTLGPVETFRPASPTLKLSVDAPEVYALRDAVFVPPLERSLTFPFSAHATLADELDEQHTEAALTALGAGTWSTVIDSMTVLREEEGRVWQPLAEARFGAPRVLGRGGIEFVLRRTRVIDPFTTETFGIDEPYEHAVVAWQDERAVGVITWADREVVTLGVHEAFRSMGVGTALARTTLEAGVLLVPRTLERFFARLR